MRIAMSALLLLAATACGGPRGPDPNALPASPLARAALVEWQAWGRVVVVGWPEARPADTAATQARFDRLLGYWSAIPDHGGVVRRLSELRSAMAASMALPDAEPLPGAPPAAPASGSEDIGIYAYPAWSAAFVSAVARSAWVPEYDLPSTSRHATYIDAILARWLTERDNAPFQPYAPEEVAPRPGDLVCADRATRPLLHWSDRLAETGRPRPMHCDIVVRSAPGRVEAVGGNVKDMVVLRHLPAGRDGRLLPAPPGAPVFILVLAARGSPRAGAPGGPVLAAGR